MSWGDSLGLGPVTRKAHTSTPYPPPDFSSAWNLGIDKNCTQQYDRASTFKGPILPKWAITWPLGQLAALHRCGVFAKNIKRYLMFFKREQLEVVALEELSEMPAIALGRIARLVPLPQDVVKQWVFDQGSKEPIHVNKAAQLDENMEPDVKTIRRLAVIYSKSNDKLYELIGRDLGWQNAEHYRVRTRKGTEFIRSTSFCLGEKSRQMLEDGEQNGVARSGGVRKVSSFRHRRHSVKT